VAPDAKLVDVKVLTDWGFGGKLYEGIEWCITNQDTFSIDVLTISIGEMMGGNSDGQDSNGRIAQQAVDNGMVVVAAIGNDGNEHIGISSPAAADNVIAVGALDEQDSVNRDDDWIADFSNSGPREDDGDSDDMDELKPDVTAPGVGIQSANSYNGNLLIIKASGYVSLSGTSMACPHVAGICALLMQANPDMTPEEVQDIMRSSSEPKGETYDPSYEGYSTLYGWGMVDAYNALKMSTGDYQKVEILSPSQGELVYSTIDISGTATNNEGSIIEVDVRIDDGNWDIAEGTVYWSYSLDTTEYSNGAHTIYIRSQNDQYEYSDEVIRAITVNNVGIEITSTSSGATVKDRVEITGTCTGTNIESVEVRIGNGAYAQALNTALEGDWSTWSYSWNTKDSDDGDYTITVRARSGQQAPTASIDLEVDNVDESKNDDSPGFQVIPLVILVFVLTILFSIKKRSSSGK
jgi:hypothetical protein